MHIDKETSVYKENNKCLMKADIYLANKQDSPVIIYIHGGGLIWGTRKDILKNQVELYHSMGFNIVAIDYRLAPETKLEKIIEDIKDAINWVKKECKDRYNMDTERIVLVGSSAGAYLALMAGSFAHRPKAIISFYGYGDILGDWLCNPSQYYCKKTMLSRSEAYKYVSNQEISEGERERFLYYLYCRQNGIWPREVSGYDVLSYKKKLLNFCPINLMKEDYPPTLLLHGDQDEDVPPLQSILIKEKLTALGVENKLILLEGKGHDFDYARDDEQVKEAFKEVITFIEKYL